MLLACGLAASFAVEIAQAFGVAQIGRLTGGHVFRLTHPAITTLTAPQMEALDGRVARRSSGDARPLGGFAPSFDKAGIRVKAIPFAGGRANSILIAALALVGTLHGRESVGFGALGSDLLLWHGEGRLFCAARGLGSRGRFGCRQPLGRCRSAFCGAWCSSARECG